MPRAFVPIDPTTAPPADPRGGVRGRESLFGTGFVILVYPYKPRRNGEVAFFPDDGSTVYLARGDADPETKLGFFPQRPGGHAVVRSLLSPTLPRRAAAIHKNAHGVFVFDRAGGSRRLFLNGELRDHGELHPGDTLLVEGEILLQCVLRLRHMARLEYFPEWAMGPFGEADKFGNIGESPAKWNMCGHLGREARTELNTIVVGETGTGKEHAARTIHGLSDRAKKPLVAPSGASIPDSLAEAEIFGSMKNHPNMGSPERPGYFGAADGGILFLDEIAEMSPEVQKKLLRALSARLYFRLGESVGRPADVRVIGATNRNVDDPRCFRHDLRERFSVVTLPPLRERAEDIALLLPYYARLAAALCDLERVSRLFREVDGVLEPQFDMASVARLVRMPLAGNVRQVQRLVKYAVTAGEGDGIEVDLQLRVEAYRPAPVGSLLPAPVVPAASASAHPPSAAPTAVGGGSGRMSARSAALTREEAEEALGRNGGNKAGAARELGLGRHALDRALVRLGVEKG